MRAINPKTGKPITIMKTKTQITKNSRTLLWYKEGLTGDSNRWKRWSVILTEDDPLTINPDLIFLYNEPTEDLTKKWSAWLKTRTSSNFIIATPAWFMALKLNAAQDPAVLATTELYQRYPFLPDLKETDSKEDWLLSIAQLMRFHTFVTPNQLTDEKQIFRGKLRQIEKEARAEEIVPAVWLIQQYFIHGKPHRQKEIDTVLERNIECKYIDKIVLLNEKIYNIPVANNKIEQVNIGHRLKYLDVFSYIKNSVPKETIVIFANSDIYLDNSLKILYSINLEKNFMALLRYDVSESKMEEPKLFGPRPDSQDTWILWSSSIDFELTEEQFGFNFGVPGCDNTITTVMLSKKFVVSNPCLSIRSYHLHNSNIRNYIISDVIDKPVFLYVEPTGIQDYAAVKDMNPYKVNSWPKVNNRSFQRPIKCVDKITGETICKMLTKNNSPYNFSVHSENTFNKGYNTGDNVLYEFNSSASNSIFTMPSGVVCNFDSLFVGDHPIWAEEWSKTSLTILTNTVHIPEMVALHFPPEMAGSASQWFLHYFPNVIKIYLHTNQKPEFIVSIHPDTQRALQLLNWINADEVTMIPYLPDSQYVSEKVYGLTPSSFPEVPAENIDLLRKMLPAFEPSVSPSVVIVAERISSSSTSDPIMSNSFCNEIVKNIFNRKDRGHWLITIVDADTPTESRLESLMKADLVISQSDSEWDALDWCWLLQPKKTVIEIMPDTKPRGDHIHIAGASNLNYVLLGVKREPLPFQRQHIIEDLEKVMNEHLFSETLKAQVPKSSLPTIILPSGAALTGMHEHAGDTFREMVTIWEERKYCNVVRHEDTPYVWWSAIGDVLLYDRPTLRWFNNPSYNLALFANTGPKLPTKNDKPWSFWPRSPKAVESIVATNKVLTSWEKRTIPSIFLGKIENGVQKQNRTTHDWSQVIHTFNMPIDSTGGPYKYNQEEYLNLLTQSRFGLCLPGFGQKCNREIEYFATGTVPIITPGVDMTNYSSAPKENVHYFIANEPKDVTRIVETTSQEKWTEMSIACRAWWRRFASAEGLFRLTWGLVIEDKLEKQILTQEHAQEQSQSQQSQSQSKQVHEHGPGCKHTH